VHPGIPTHAQTPHTVRSAGTLVGRRIAALHYYNVKMPRPHTVLSEDDQVGREVIALSLALRDGDVIRYERRRAISCATFEHQTARLDHALFCLFSFFRFWSWGFLIQIRLGLRHTRLKGNSAALFLAIALGGISLEGRRVVRREKKTDSLSISSRSSVVLENAHRRSHVKRTHA
jgi:hypothetical protein